MTEPILIKVYPDGNQMCAIIGDMPEEEAIGFGDTIYDAIQHLIDDMYSWKHRCDFCWSPNTTIRIIPNGTFIKCNECNYLGGKSWDEYINED